MSTSSVFILGQRILVPNNDNVLVEETHNANNDVSYQVVKELHKSVMEQDLERFVSVYQTQYIDDNSICNHFQFGDTSPYEDFSTYSLCTCPGKNGEPHRINKYMYTRACFCANGKRYLAYLCAYNQGTRNDYHIKDASLDQSTSIKEYLLQDGPIDLSYTSTIHFFPDKHV